MARISKDHINYFYEHNLDLSTKTIYLGYGDEDEAEIDHVLAADILKGLHLLDSVRPDEPIRIIMNCTGGDVTHGLAIYDAIRRCKSQVEIEVYGHCYSMAAWILQAGDVRRMSKHSSMMIHDGEQSMNGRKKDMMRWQAFEQEQDKACSEILLGRIREKQPQFTQKRLDKMLATDTIFWPKQALELGLIDEVIE